MKAILFATSALVLFANCADAGRKEAENAFKRAEVAHEECKTTWFKSRRETSLEEISSAGEEIAFNLNPLSPDADEIGRMLERVTEMLRDCTKFTFGDDS